MTFDPVESSGLPATMGSELDLIRRQLAGHRPRLSSMTFETTRVRAAVALLVRDRGTGVELLMIRRARSEGDPWSGDIAFPGGRVDSAAESARAAAERETAEEVGIDLGCCEYLGRLDDLTGRTHAVLVSAFVYAVAPDMAVDINFEVDTYRWMPLSEVADPAHHVVSDFNYRQREFELPALRVFDDDGPLLWGLTYGFLDCFMRIVERPIPQMPWREEL